MNKFVRVSSWMVFCLLIGAIVCMSAFNVIGQTVETEGVLHEPFFLIPFFWLFLLLSLIAGIANIFARVIRARRKTES